MTTSLSSGFNKFAGKLLVSNIAADGGLNDIFHRAVFFILQDDAFGTAGVDLAHKVNKADADRLGLSLFKGGPLQHVSILSPSDVPTLHPSEVVENAPFASFTSTFAHGAQTIAALELTDLSSSKVIAGAAGWGHEQLEAEVEAGFWSVVDADAELVFNTPADELYDACVRRIGPSLTLQ